MAWAAARPCPLGATASTRPSRRPSSAVKTSPSSAMRRTSCDPKRRTVRCVPDQPGMMPRPVSGEPSFTCSSAMRKSAVAASSSPPPSVWPFSAAISGWRRRASASKARWPWRTQARPKSVGRQRRPGLDVAARAEGLLALARDDGSADAACRLDQMRGALERQHHFIVERIELFRPRDGDGGEMARRSRA